MGKGSIRSFGSSKYGMGHLFRTSAIADILAKKDIAVKFLMKSEEIKELSGFLKSKNIPFLENDGRKFENYDFFLYDMPFPDREFIANFKKANPLSRIVALDFSDPEDSNVDVVVNLFDHERMLKGRENNSRTEFLCGLSYAIIREQFPYLRNPRKTIRDEIKNILISFGGSDPCGWTCKLIQDQKIFRGLNVKAVMGPNFAHREELVRISRSLPENMKVTGPVTDIEKHMADSDLMICGGRTTVLESMFLGVPAIVVPQTEDERIFGGWLQNNDACLLANFAENNLEEKLMKLRNCETRRKISENGMRLVDGKGTERIAAILLR